MNRRFAPHNRVRAAIGRQIRADWFSAVRSAVRIYGDYINPPEGEQADDSGILDRFQELCAAVLDTERLAETWDVEIPLGLLTASQRTAYRRAFHQAGEDHPMTFGEAMAELAMAFPTAHKGAK